MGLSKRIWQSDDGTDIVTSSYVVHTFILGDVDDPDIYAAEPIWKWQQSEAGQWVMKNSYDKPTWQKQFNVSTYGHLFQIRADLTPEQITFFELKFR
jgi:uncharacterized protein YvpB